MPGGEALLQPVYEDVRRVWPWVQPGPHEQLLPAKQLHFDLPPKQARVQCLNPDLPGLPLGVRVRPGEPRVQGHQLQRRLVPGHQHVEVHFHFQHLLLSSVLRHGKQEVPASGQQVQPSHRDILGWAPEVRALRPGLREGLLLRHEHEEVHKCDQLVQVRPVLLLLKGAVHPAVNPVLGRRVLQRDPEPLCPQVQCVHHGPILQHDPARLPRKCLAV